MHKNSQSGVVHQNAEVARKSQDVMHDKQNERDTRELRIDKVGVRGLRFPIQIRDKARRHSEHDCDDRDVRGFAEGIQRDAT